MALLRTTGGTSITPTSLAKQDTRWPGISRTMPPMNWGHEVTEQLRWHWENHVRPRLDGLTDVEYLWEPASDCWNLRQQGGVWVPDFAWPEPDPAPLTTIAWRLSHVIVGLF